MAVSRFEMIVHYEDGRDPVSVVADQRDIAMFEREEKVGFTQAMDQMQMVFFRALGWFSMRRTGKIPAGVKRADWEREVIEVELADDEEVDPTNQEASGATS
jgi:hypothetical protein